MNGIKRFAALWLCLASTISSFAQQGFVWPVMTEQATSPQSNTVDPVTVSSADEGWVINNTLGSECPSCSNDPTHPYHPGFDLNRKDGNDGNVPVYSIDNGEVIRYQDLGSLGVALVILYELSATVDFQRYALAGTVMRSDNRFADQVSVMYLHMDKESVTLREGNQVSRGEYVGQILPAMSHLHFEGMVGNEDSTAWPYINNRGYYQYQQDISTWGNVNIWQLIDDFQYPWNGQAFGNVSMPAVPGGFDDGWHAATANSLLTRGVSDRIMECYQRKGGLSALGAPHDNGGTMYVHVWNGVTQQDFRRDPNDCVIVYNPDLNLAFLLQHGFRLYYLTHNGPGTLGKPWSDEY